MFNRLFCVCFLAALIMAFTLPNSVYAQKPIFKEVSVHDPSIIETNGTFYVFGSHLASAKSNDLMQWQQISSSVTNNNPLIPNVYEELKETFEWAQSDTLWAADVTQLADGKYYMYYNACRGDSPRSAMGVAVADNIEGPYKNKGIFLKSGMEGTSNDGTPYDATKHPNVVDPHTFFDKDGKLWMVYGSYSGGIFILEMNPKTGFPLPGQGYGKKLLGGNHSRIEGPYVLYNPDTQYYYLYLSYAVSMQQAATTSVWPAPRNRTALTMMQKAIQCSTSAAREAHSSTTVPSNHTASNSWAATLLKQKMKKAPGTSHQATTPHTMMKKPGVPI